MIRTVRWLVPVLPALLLVLLHSQDRVRENMSVVHKENFTRTFSPPAAPGLPELAVDTVEGSIVVDAYEGREIQVEIARTIRARTSEDIARAQSEVELKVSEKGRRTELYVDGPFRCSDGSMRRRDLGYRVSYDFRVKVPRDCDLVLRTITGGDLRVTGVSGNLDVGNVNGGINLTSVAGGVRAHTVNGGVGVSFSRNPGAECSFRTVNGDLEVSLKPGLSADLWFKTFNGGAYTDYDVSALPPAPVERESAGGRFVYKSGRSFGVRAGKGGPKMTFDTLNGDIRVKSQ